MGSRLFILQCALTALCAEPLRGSDARVDPPTGAHNIVLILADDLGVDLVSAYDAYYSGLPNPAYPVSTPAIDYLAETGLLFRNAWTIPSCSPSRAQILTGKHGHHSGIGGLVQQFAPITHGLGLRVDQGIIPTMLREASTGPSWYTAAVGKWHLADVSQHWQGAPAHPLGGASGRWFQRYAGSMFNLGAGGYNQWNKTFATSIEPMLDECAPPPSSWCEAPVVDYATADTADDAIYLVRALPEPFFLYVAFNAVHAPLASPSAPLDRGSCHGAVQHGILDWILDGDAPRKTRRMTEWLDHEVGRVLCALEEDRQMPTLPVTIIFLGDNGTDGSAIVPPFDPSHEKGTLYQGGINVPFIVKSPRIRPSLVGTATDALACSTDILATIGDLAEVTLPPDPHGLRDSVSFLDVMTGTASSPREYVYAEDFRCNFIPTSTGVPLANYTLARHDRAIRNRAGFKLIQSVRPDGLGGFLFMEELYDLSVDPHERQDRMPDMALGKEPFASYYLALRLELDATYPHLVTP